jgi:hypothetical protein
MVGALQARTERGKEGGKEGGSSHASQLIASRPGGRRASDGFEALDAAEGSLVPGEAAPTWDDLQRRVAALERANAELLRRVRSLKAPEEDGSAGGGGVVREEEKEGDPDIARLQAAVLADGKLVGALDSFGVMAELAKERDEGATAILDDAVEIHSMFRDVHHLVDEQGVSVREVERNAQSARSATARATEDLHTANETHRNAPCTIA